MNTKLFLPFVLALPMLAVSCDKAADAADGAKDAVENLDLTDPAKMKTAATDAVSSLTSGLAGLGDMTDVTKIKDKVGGLMGSANILEKLKGVADFKIPGLDTLKAPLDSLKSKFAGKDAIMKVVQPLIDKLSGLMG